MEVLGSQSDPGLPHPGPYFPLSLPATLPSVLASLLFLPPAQMILSLQGLCSVSPACCTIPTFLISTT